MREQGSLAIVLHAHLPFVRHPEHDDFLEEDWLFEAITETYLPLLAAFERLRRDAVPFRLSLVVSPTLAAMLTDALLRSRYVRYLDRRVELAEREIDRTRGDGRFEPLARMYREMFARSRRLFLDDYNGDLVRAFRTLQDAGSVELMACGATHGFLPLLEVHPEAVRAQIRVGVEEHERHFGRRPRGFWLPECAYTPTAAAALREEDIRYVVMDTHGVIHATPRPRFGVYAPIFTPSGVAAFGRDPETSRQVWSSVEGYPGDPRYRDFYRDIGYDLDYDYIRPYIQPTGDRKSVGIKYHRITGGTTEKAPYDPELAQARAVEHAEHFLAKRERQMAQIASQIHRPPIVVAPYDAELFGHWWWEGPRFIEAILRASASQARTYRLATPGDYLEENPTQQVARPAMSSWGGEGYAQVWLNEQTDWIYPHTHMAQERMIRLARAQPHAEGVTRRALDQAARELLLAQASDWPFIISAGTAVSYAEQRVRDHLDRFSRIYDQLTSGTIDSRWLRDIEDRDNLFPNLDYRVYC